LSQEKQRKGLPRISFEISKELEGGVYVNQAFIIHSGKEFILDLGLALPTGKIKVQARVITNPVDAKAIYLALKENIEGYERQYGPIPVPKPPPKPENKQVH
jgi:hypothetical protein